MIRPLKISLYLFVFIGLVFSTQSCEPDAIADQNPFEENVINQDTVYLDLEDIDPNSIAGLYQNIFKPTCANVGCHDGLFEPDFRTIESSYHSMVYRDPIKNDGTLTYRVDPGNPEKSAIIKRLDGSIQPIMPIEIEPDGDWLEKKEQYIQNVRNWIDNGALDLAGNIPQPNFVNPSLFGAFAQFEGELLDRENVYGPILIPDTADVIRLYMSFDTINNPGEFTTNKLIFGYEDDEVFHQDTSVIMEVLDTPVTQYGLYGTLIEYTHRVVLDLNELLLTEDQYFMRAYVQDGTHPVTEIPSNNGLYYIKEYMSFNRTD